MKRLYYAVLFLGCLQGFAQTNPAAQSLPFSFTSQSGSTLPAGMAIHRFGTTAGAIPTTRTTGTANGDLPYTGTSTSGGWKDEGNSGLSLLASGSQSAGALVVAVNTSNKTNIQVSWKAGTILQQGSRDNSVALQYRVGTSGSWTDVGTTTTYSSQSKSNGDLSATLTETLPVAAEGQSVVQVRWIYWESNGTTGSRDRINLDEISITGNNSAQPDINLQQPAGTDQVCGFSYNFGTQLIGSNTDVTIRIQNLGTGDLAISSYPLSGTHAGEFSIQTSPSTPVAPSGYTDIVVRFTPSLPGSKSATLTINSDDVDEGACTVDFSANAVYNSCSELIISEYGEGASGFQKYIELFNGTGSAINLGDYQLQKVSNGGTWPEFILNLSGTLNSGQTYVIANNSTDVPGADWYNTFCDWTGNDAVGLAKNISGTYYLIDAVGDETDPGTGWQVAGVNDATKDHTLVRKTSVTTPNTDWTVTAGGNTSNSEWFVRPYGLSNLDCHINACSVVSTVGFVSSNATVTESGTTVTVQVSMDMAPAADVSVNVNDALLGTAAAGSDYSYTNTVLSFLTSETYPVTKSVTVTILDDAISESNENIVLSIDAQCGALIGSGTHTITIQDDETPEGIIINEFSQGSSSKEYVELVVTGTPGTTIDLRGWIIDDNSGIFSGGYGTQMGIAPGHLKFSNICTWEKVPVGSIILIYNALDKNASITLADDPTDANLDYTYVIGIQAASGACSGMATANAYFSSDCLIPNNTSYDIYTPPSYTNADWNAMQFRNSGDALQVRSAAGGFFHGLSYGNKGSGSDCSTCAITQANHPDYPIYGTEALYFSGGSNVTYAFRNTSNDDYRQLSNWTKTTSSSPNALETPGTYNNAANQTWILSLRSPFNIVTDDQSYTCDLRAYESRYYLDNTDKIIFHITNNGATDHGSFTAQTILHDDATTGLGFQNSNLTGTPLFLQKTFAATPTTYNPADYKIEFFYTTQELQDYCDYINPIIDVLLSTTGTNFTPATIKGFLKIYRTSLSDRAWMVTSDAQTEIVMPVTGTYGAYHTFEHDGFTSFSGYALGVTVNELISNILPVELASFNAACLEGKIHVSWSTASEDQASHFELERSYDAAHFSMIASLPAAGNSNALRHYLFADDNFSAQKQVYYRLKQVDLDGSYEYSNIITQKCGAAVPLVAVYPNPTNGMLFIEFSGNVQQYERIDLYDVTGRLVKRMAIRNAGKVEMNLSDLASGVYILSAEHPGGWSYRQKIIRE